MQKQNFIKQTKEKTGDLSIFLIYKKTKIRTSESSARKNILTTKHIPVTQVKNT